MDKILSYWAEREDAFPEGIRTRKETGCCGTYGVAPEFMEAAGADHVAPE